MANWGDGWSQQRSIHIFSDIDQNMAGQTIQQIYGFAALSSEPITLFINSNGGDVFHAFAMIEAMCACPVPLRTVALGHAFSAALLVFMSAPERLALRNTLFMAHDFTTGNAPYAKVKRQGEWIRERLINLFRHHTNIIDDIAIEKLFLVDDFFFSEEMAKNFGIVDKIIYTLPIIPYH